MVKKKVRNVEVTTQLWEVRESEIHGNGIFAAESISAEDYIIEYLGEKVTKAESDRRGLALLEESKKTGGASVCIFILNKRHDVDGNFSWNPARFINHSCDPNCEAINYRGNIWIVALKDIRKGTELTYDYGYEVEHYEDHPCRCGTKKCVGYIVAASQRRELKKLLRKKTTKEKSAKKKKSSKTKKKSGKSKA